jgi:hypothetical protein
VLLANAGACRLIEFKRAGALTNKEVRKLERLTNAIVDQPYAEQLSALSRSIHWYIEVRAPIKFGDPVVSMACPYLDFADNQPSLELQASVV